MKRSVVKYFVISLGLHFFLISFFLFKNDDFQKTITSILLVEIIPTHEDDQFKVKKVPKLVKSQVNFNENRSIKKQKTVEEKLTSKKEYHQVIKKKIKNKSEERSLEEFKIQNLTKTINSKKKNFTKAVYKIGSINNPHPPYPLIARKRGWQGKLTLNVWVNNNGWVDDINVKKSSGYKILDDISLQTIKKWHFIPARSGEKNVKDKLDIPVKFVLSE